MLTRIFILLILLIFSCIIDIRLICSHCMMMIWRWRFFRWFFSFSNLFNLFLFQVISNNIRRITLRRSRRSFKELHLPKTWLLLSPFVSILRVLLIMLDWLLNPYLFLLNCLRNIWKLWGFTVFPLDTVSHTLLLLLLKL